MMHVNFDDAADQALDLTGRLIDELGPRPSCSEESRQAADTLQKEAAVYADSSWTENFTARPSAFLGWIRLLVVIYLLAVALLWAEAIHLALSLAEEMDGELAEAETTTNPSTIRYSLNIESIKY
ncbi:MAG: hypothetical protein JSW55_14055 [Chloroflexota bacterium]|nr:MAG: hypothetical protein JSW55_14055 [Chloroflexota bacterium]